MYYSRVGLLSVHKNLRFCVVFVFLSLGYLGSHFFPFSASPEPNLPAHTATELIPVAVLDAVTVYLFTLLISYHIGSGLGGLGWTDGLGKRLGKRCIVGEMKITIL